MPNEIYDSNGKYRGYMRIGPNGAMQSAGGAKGNGIQGVIQTVGARMRARNRYAY